MYDHAYKRFGYCLHLAISLHFFGSSKNKRDMCEVSPLVNWEDNPCKPLYKIGISYLLLVAPALNISFPDLDCYYSVKMFGTVSFCLLSPLGVCAGHGEVGVRTNWNAVTASGCTGWWERLEDDKECSCGQKNSHNFIFV